VVDRLDVANSTAQTAQTSTILVDQPAEPLLVELPSGRSDMSACAGLPWLVMVHALGENRTGNNYWQACTARIIAAGGVVVARFDLCGYGESLADKSVRAWVRQCEDAIQTARRYGASTVHLSARGLHAALLGPLDVPGERIALFPPNATQLRWLDTFADRTDDDVIRVDQPPSGDELTFWTTCGSEPNLIQGSVFPLGVLRTLRTWLADQDGSTWTLTVGTVHDVGRANTLVCGADPLTRLESDRIGLAHLLRRHLTQLPGRTGGDGG